MNQRSEKPRLVSHQTERLIEWILSGLLILGVSAFTLRQDYSSPVDLILALAAPPLALLMFMLDDGDDDD